MRDELALRRQCLTALQALAARFPELQAADARTRLSAYLLQQHALEGAAMPAKDSRTLGEDLDMLSFRVPHAWSEQIDAHAQTLKGQAPWATVRRSDAARDLLKKGLESLSQTPKNGS